MSISFKITLYGIELSRRELRNIDIPTNLSVIVCVHTKVL